MPHNGNVAKGERHDSIHRRTVRCVKVPDASAEMHSARALPQVRAMRVRALGTRSRECVTDCMRVSMHA